MYKACLVNCHPHCIFWTTVPRYSVGHSFFIQPRQLCCTWCQCKHLEFPSPSWRVSRTLWVPCKHTSWNPLYGSTCEWWWCILWSLPHWWQNGLSSQHPFYEGAVMLGPGWKVPHFLIWLSTSSVLSLPRCLPSHLQPSFPCLLHRTTSQILFPADQSFFSPIVIRLKCFDLSWFFWIFSSHPSTLP